MKKLIQLKNGGEKCPYCSTIFIGVSLHPFDIAVREEFKARRSKAAKKGWQRRKRKGN